MKNFRMWLAGSTLILGALASPVIAGTEQFTKGPIITASGAVTKVDSDIAGEKIKKCHVVLKSFKNGFASKSWTRVANRIQFTKIFTCGSKM